MYKFRDSVYLLLASNGLVKIGKSDKPKLRMQVLASLSPIPCEPVGYWQFENARKVEKQLHHAYEELRVKHEWFDINPDLLQQLVEWLDRQERIEGS